MVVTEKDLSDAIKLLDAIQTYQDNQIRCKDMASDIVALRELSNTRAIEHLEIVMGKGCVSNKALRKVLNEMHPYVVTSCKSGLGVYEE